MRGKGNRETGHSDKIGITPAHAGKSRRFNVMSLENWDHPRTCGEKDPAAEIGDAVTGSPPHMRGKDSESLEIQALIFSSAHFPFNF